MCVKIRLWKINVQQPVYYVASSWYAHYGGFVNVCIKLLAKRTKNVIIFVKI